VLRILSERAGARLRARARLESARLPLALLRTPAGVRYPMLAGALFACVGSAQRMPASISLVSASIVLGVTVPAPVLSDNPGILYLAVITHCTTGMKP
jgi:hypothetical protein